MPDHPGGDDILLQYAGGDVGQIMGDESEHVHSASAYEMMDEYKVGELGGDEKIVSEGGSMPPADRTDVCRLTEADWQFFQTGCHRKISIPTKQILWPISTVTNSSISPNRSWSKSGMHGGRKNTTCHKYTTHGI